MRWCGCYLPTVQSVILFLKFLSAAFLKLNLTWLLSGSVIERGVTPVEIGLAPRDVKGLAAAFAEHLRIIEVDGMGLGIFISPGSM